MRLKQHINEASESYIKSSLINEEIQKNCKQYLKLIRGKNPQLRGLNGYYDSGIKDVRKDRKPYGMERNEADALNLWLQKKGHARRDKSVLCTSRDDLADMFGETYWIFPLDKIKRYTWIETKDINLDDKTWSGTVIPSWYIVYTAKDHLGSVVLNAKKDLEDTLDKPFEDYFYTNTGFSIAIAQGYEMWIECDKYYYVNPRRFKWDRSKQILTDKQK